LLRRANDYVFESVKGRVDLREKIEELREIAEYKSATDPERMLMKVAVLQREIGDTELLLEVGALVSLASAGKIGFPIKLSGRSKADKLYRFARVFSYAVEVFGNEERARRWLLRAQFSLNGEIPMEMLRTGAGAQEVETLLGRIDYGILA